MAYTEIILPEAESTGTRTSADTETAKQDGIVIVEESSHWSISASDPNAQNVVEDRALVLASAWRPPVADRMTFLRERVADKTVLDVGCVAHDEQRMRSANWLHSNLADKAKRCIGVDVLDEGIAAMRDSGYEAVAHDLSNGLGPLAESGPFDVIVAGELIEHVANLDMLFATAADGLAADGELILTTPNPYAPARVRAGQRGDVWENVDHIMYAFPSGIAELASRHGLILAEAMTTEPTKPKLLGPFTWLKRTIRRSRWHRRGFSTTAGAVRPIILDRRDRIDWLRSRVARELSSHHSFVGETFIYVVSRGPLR